MKSVKVSVKRTSAPHTVPPSTYNLQLKDLTELEAKAIMTVCRSIGGPPEGLRGVFGSIQSALGDQGIPQESLNKTYFIPNSFTFLR
jgi:hypothetical protein